MSTNATAGYVKVKSYYPEPLMNAIALQPVSLGVAASSNVFMYYRSGIISSSTCGTSVNHAVLAVGYGTDTVTG